MSEPNDPDHHSFELQGPGGLRISARGLGLIIAGLIIVAYIVRYLAN